MDIPQKTSKAILPEQDSSEGKKGPLKSKPKFKFSPGNAFSVIKTLFASTRNIIGLDIGTSYIKIAQLQKVNKGYTITNCLTRVIPLEVRDNPEGKKKLAQQLIKEFVSDTRIKTKLCRLAISGRGVFIFSLAVPFLSKKDLKGAVSIELKKRLPFQVDLEHISFDYFVTGQIKDEKGVMLLQVTCIAADNLIITESIAFLKELNIRPIAVNAIPDAMTNLIPFCVDAKPDQSVTILDLGANSSLLNFYKGDMLQFSRDIPVGGEQITKALTKDITIPTGTINLSVEEAEKIKWQCGIPLEEEARTEYFTDSGMLLGNQVSTLIRPALERLVTEIVRTFNYYTHTFRVPRIDKLYLTGGTCRLKNIDKFLLGSLRGVGKVERLNTLKAAKGWADMGVFKQEMVMEQAAPHLSAAFGVCLRNGGKINLLPLKERIEQKANYMMTLAKIFFPMILGLGILFYASIFAGAFRYKALVAQAEGNLDKLGPSINTVNEFLSLKSMISQRKNLLEDAVGRQPLWWGIFKELSIITPPEVILNKITTVKKQYPLEIRLAGEIFAKYTTVDLALSQYLLALDESPFFSRVQLVSTQKDMYSAVPRASFVIVCRLSY
ncbi:MAG: pilus assembly protein PilM [Candidatus Omnitrophota bacterium]